MSSDTVNTTPDVIRVDNKVAGSSDAAGGLSSNGIDNLSEQQIDIPAVTQLTANTLRAGFVSISWQASDGDVYQTHPSGDTVSYYRVYRNGEFLLDAFSPSIEDNSAPSGSVVYAVEAHKLLRSPEYALLHSTSVELEVLVPSFASDAAQNAATELSQADYANALASFKTCASSHVYNSDDILCGNEFGYAWLQHADGSSGRLITTTSSLAGDVLVSVRNTEAELGPIPGVPTWSVKSLSTGIVTRRDVSLGIDALLEGEGHVVNGVAVANDGTVFISGTLYQSYLPRNLGPEVGLLPVTNAYYLAQFETSTGEQLQFKRFSLAEAPGAASAVNNGVLEMHQLGQVSLFDTATLSQQANFSVSGYPIFADSQYVYTQAFDPDAYYRFERVIN